MKVKVDGAIDGVLVAECSHLLPDRWNGWVQPVFTLCQANEVVGRLVSLGWATKDEAPSLLTHIGEGEWVTYGFTWEVVG